MEDLLTLDRLNDEELETRALDYFEGYTDAKNVLELHASEKQRAQAQENTKRDYMRLAQSGFGGYLREVAQFALAEKRGAKISDFPGLALMTEMNCRAYSGMNETIPSEGGIAVPTTWAGPILQGIYDNTIIARKCRHFTIERTGALTVPMFDETDRATGSRHGGIRSYWKQEGALLTNVKPRYKVLNLAKKKLTCCIPVTNETINDAPALAEMLTPAVQDDMAWMLQDAFLNGDGAGKPLGALKSGACIEVALETGQTATGGIQVENLNKMYSSQFNKDRAEWYVNDELVQQLAENCSVDGSGSRVFERTPQGAFIFGRPVHFVEQAQAKNTKGDISFCDFSEYTIFDQVLGISTSLDVLFLTDEMVFKFVLRIDGEPSWKTSIKPANSLDPLRKVSPFVTLATRS